MIIEAILELIVGAFTSLISLFVSVVPSPPAWWIQVASAVSSVVSLIPGPVRHFLPLTPLSIAGLTLMGWSISLSVLKLARRALSLFTGGGGAID